MAVYLGNLSIDDFIKRTGYDITDEDRKVLESHRQDSASVASDSDKFHIFDVPFAITVGEHYSQQLVNILQKYENIKKSKSQLYINVAKESDKEREIRLQRAKAELEWQNKLKNKSAIWLVKWQLYVPVIVNSREYYYWCFVNTYTTGRENIPNIIDGKGEISLDDSGFTGTFKLYNPEMDNDANEHDEWNYVVGCGFVTKSNSYIGKLSNAQFNNVEFSIKDCIQNYLNFNDSAKDIHFHKIKDENNN